ncbi:MAG: hypothetical protein IM607_09205 [Cytophagales bacterium]|jgi:hypothetical protein|nr:hypothetical protein [Cytophagales bacterium]
MNNLKTKEDRQEAIKQIERSFLNELRNIGVELSDDAVCRINQNSIEIGISAIGKYAEKGYQMAFASAIELYAKRYDNELGFGRKENEINFGSSGSFNPSERESYWRTIHAASVLKNWAIVSEIVNIHCKMYSDLSKKIFEVNVQS